MPYLFLSPSTQEGNEFITGGSEEYWMNQIADAMEPFLHAAGINVIRNDPAASATTAIRQSNLDRPGFHLALHSNAAPGENAGQARYSIVFYYPGSRGGERMANLLVDALKQVYPLPDRVRAEANASIGELRQVRAPAAFVELAFHDNPEDAAWMTENVQQIAGALSRAVTEYFDLPFITPIQPRTGMVQLRLGRLNLRSEPDDDAPILRTIPNGASVQILGEEDDWYSVQYQGTYGWVNEDYIRI